MDLESIPANLTTVPACFIRRWEKVGKPHIKPTCKLGKYVKKNCPKIYKHDIIYKIIHLADTFNQTDL